MNGMAGGKQRFLNRILLESCLERGGWKSAATPQTANGLLGARLHGLNGEFQLGFYMDACMRGQALLLFFSFCLEKLQFSLQDEKYVG